jgi:TatD DNase family protein
MVTIATQLETFPRTLVVAEAHDNIFATVGTHPHHAQAERDVVTTERLLELAAHPKVIGIGEAGLDYFYDRSPRDVQIDVFRRHIAAARQSGLPLVIHTREAEEDTAEILKDETKKSAFPFVLHCFSSAPWLAELGVELGGYVSFSGILTFKKSDAVREAAAATPMNRLLVETDAPFLAPVPHRGKPCEPAYTALTLEKLAEIKGVSREEMARRTTENFFGLFGKAKPPAEAA